MPVTGLIEQAPRNAYYMSDALGGDILFRTLCNNSWIFGDGSNATSTMRINKNMISTTAGTFTHAGVFGVSNLNPQYTLDVAGDINLTGILRQNGSPYIGSQLSNTSNAIVSSSVVAIPGYAIANGTLTNSNYTFSNAGSYVQGTSCAYDMDNTTYNNFDAMGGYNTTYQGTAPTTNGVSGAWIQIQSTTSFAIGSYQMAFEGTDWVPTEWYVFGSTNGTSWTQVDYQNFAWSNASQVPGTVTLGSVSSSYNYYRLVFSKAKAGAPTISLATLQWYSPLSITSFSNALFLPSNFGNLGIGITNPQFNLHVPGTIATSNLRVNNLTGTGSTINIGTDSNISTINIGGANSTVNLIGSLSYVSATDLTVADKRITLNKNGGSGTAGDAGIEIEEGGSIRGYIRTSTDRNSFLFRTPNGSNDFTMNLINNAANFNNNLLVLNSNSRVGIGTNNPGYTFEVQGVINASSNILINGQSLQAGYWVSTGTSINWTQSNVTIGTSSNPTGMRLYLAGTGTTNTGGTGDMTNITSNLLTLYDINHPRVVHRSGNASISTIYNFESNKSVYWGETADTGYYSFRGRGLSVGYTTIPGSNYTLDINGIANISDRLLVTNNIGVGTTNNSEKITIAAGNVALVHGGTYGNNGSSDKWISIGDRTQTLAPQFQQSNYGITMTWDTDGCFFGLRDFGSSRKDTVISFGDDTTDNLRFMYSNSADYMTITGTGNVGIGRSNPTYRLDINGDINFTGTLRSNGTPFVGGGGGASGWSNNSSNVFVIGSNVGIGTSTPQRALHVVGDVQFDSNIFIANNTNIALRGLLISKRNAGQSSTSITSLVTSINGFTYNSNVIIQSASACNIQLLSSNVGVGRSNPAYALDVLGDINFTGTFRQNGTAYVGSQWSNSGANVFITGSNVGIGTSTPSFALDVGGTVNLSNSPLRIPGGSNCILFQNSDPGDMIVRAYSTAGDRYGIGQYAAGITRLFSSTTFSSATVRISGPTNDVRTGTAAFTDYLTVLTGGANAGRVGIGTTSPGFALDVSGDINFSGTLRQGGSAYIGSQWSNNGSQIFINGSNVAIGKTTAATALDVNGTVTATSFTEGGVALSSKYLQSSGGNTFSTSNVYAGSNDTSNLPGHSWTNDTGTGMFRPSLCNIGLATGGIERFRMTSNGNIGINRTVPGYLLDVNGSLNGVSIFENATPLTTRYAQSNILQTYSNFVNGQYAPSNQLANYQTITAFNTYSNFVNGQYAPSNAIANASTFRWNSSNAFISGCNVGINTNTPARALHVAGDIQVDSNLLMGGSIGVQGLQINRRTGGVTNIISSLPGYSWDSNITLTAATNSNINLSGNVRAQNLTTAGIRMGNTNSNIDNDAVVQMAGVASTRTVMATYMGALTEQTHIAINNTAGRVGTITSENSNVNYYGISGGAYITLASNTNVGIGTKTPGQKLEVNGSVRVGNNNANNKLLALWDGGTADAVATACNFSGFGINTSALRYQVANASNHIFYQGTSAVMLVGSNIGIGTTTPAQALDVNGTTRTTNLTTTALTGYMYGNGTSAVSASTSIPASAISGTLAVANGGTGTTTSTGNGSVVRNSGPVMAGGVRIDTDWPGNYGGVDYNPMQTTRAFSLTGWFNGPQIIFGRSDQDQNVWRHYVDLAGVSTTTDRMVWSFGTRTGANTYSWADRFIVAGNGNATLGGTLTQNSDRRMKKDIHSYNKGLNEILQLNVITYKYNGMYGSQDDNTTRIGLIAQDTLPILPECVHETEYRPYGVQDPPTEQVYQIEDHTIVYTMVKAIQEQNVIIQGLQAQLQTLTDFIASKFPGETI
jgi:hypothetical protein